MLDKNMKFPWNAPFKGSFALGRQLTIEYCDCAPKAFLYADQVEKAMLEAAQKSGATIVNSSFHKFEPQGISGVVVIAESHFTIHAWPEHDYAAVDIFTCGEDIDLQVAIESMKASFQSNNTVISSDQNRGIIDKSVKQKEISTVINNAKIHPISWKNEYEQKNPWGVTTSIDIYGCDTAIIRDADQIKKFVYQLCEMINMRRHGDCQVIGLGEDKQEEGFSMIQVMETSLISGHFAHATNAAYLNIFSCQFYEPRGVAEFASAFFKGEHYKMQIAMRE
ncbi:MAG: adenosylmethionine decarboxylase [Pseudomonadota bacterium]